MDFPQTVGKVDVSFKTLKSFWKYRFSSEKIFFEAICCNKDREIELLKIRNVFLVCCKIKLVEGKNKDQQGVELL